MAGSNLKMLKKTGNNEASDEVYTPIEAVYPLLQNLKEKEVIFECTAGKNKTLAEHLRFFNFSVITPADNYDFLTGDVPKCDVIITNPPYSKKDAFIKRCYEIGKPFALLLPITALAGKKRGDMFEKYGIELIVLKQRVDFTGKGKPHFAVAWFCWNFCRTIRGFENEWTIDFADVKKVNGCIPNKEHEY